MPGFTCCVPGCYSNSHRDKGLHFYTFPKDPDLRRQWLKNVSRTGVSGCFQTFQPTTGHRVCSLHFQGGRKSYSIRIPTIFPLRGVNEKKARRQGDRPKKRPSYPGGTTVLVTGLPEEHEVLELAGGAEMVLLGATAGMGAAMAGVEGSAVDVSGQEAAEPTQVPTLSSHYPTTETQAHTTQVSVHYPSAGHQSHPQLQVVVVGEETYPIPDCYPSPLCTDHSYSMASGTTSEELLRKLNEQRDIIALMEVKMKEMKSNIRHLRITEVKLKEEIRQKDKVLSSLIIKRKPETHY